ETCWELLGHDAMVIDTPWPKADPELTAFDTVNYAVQVNGKLRAVKQVAKGTDGEAVKRAALELPEIVRALDGKAPKRIIVVPERIVNIVV
ncbi:MAG TPA: class I tRNA ligase family protein, partial [Rhizomicrobium sp.]|nr:class I tRNA ligase family protein [Rhizomicrobium sp.]